MDRSDSATDERGAIVGQLKAYVQTILKRGGLYQRLKASRVYDLYWSVADRSLVERTQQEIKFYQRFLVGLRRGDLVFDVGANHGSKTEIFLKLGVRVVAVEPDPTNQEILREKFLTYRMSRKPVIIVRKALSDRVAVETMWIDEPGSATNTLSPKWVHTLRNDDERFGRRYDFSQKTTVETTTLDHLITAHGLPFFIKIDVEGHEPCVLRGLHHVVPYLSFEVNLPEFRPDGLECVDVLYHLATDGKFNYVAGECEKGFALEGWLGALEFSQVLAQCPDKSIEVFWKSGGPGAN
jgi:FkbM family methyltransferase